MIAILQDRTKYCSVKRGCSLCPFGLSLAKDTNPRRFFLRVRRWFDKLTANGAEVSRTYRYLTFCYALHAHPISRESPRTSNTILDSHVHGSRKKSEWMHLELAEITVYRPNGATTTAPPGPIARIRVETWQALLRAAGRSRVTTQHAPCSRRIWPGSGIIYAVVKTKLIDRIAHE